MKAQTALTIAALVLMPRPIQGCSSGVGLRSESHTLAMMSSAATTISTPSSTAEKYSALWWPNGWSLSAGMWLILIAHKAAIAVTTLAIDSSASE